MTLEERARVTKVGGASELSLDTYSETRISGLREIDWNFPASEKSESIHGVHPYPAKFIPEIPRALIEVLNPPKDAIIFDPFCGSGVTLVEAQRSGYESLGVDLNPIACLLSRVKTRHLPEDFMSQVNKAVSRSLSLYGKAPVPDIPNLDHWFRHDMQFEIAALIEAINQANTSLIVKDALRLTLSSILVRVSNQDSDTRYAARDKRLSPGDVNRLFIGTAKRLRATHGLAADTSAKCRVVEQNILEVSKGDIDKKIGLLITSPPYPNAYEYWLYHKYRMFWLGYDPIAVKKKEIGARAHYFKKSPPTARDFKVQMSYVLNLLRESATDECYACFVVGRSKVHGEIIDNAGIIIDAARQQGFALLENIERVIAATRKSFNLSHANIKTENLIILKKL